MTGKTRLTLAGAAVVVASAMAGGSVLAQSPAPADAWAFFSGTTDFAAATGSGPTGSRSDHGMWIETGYTGDNHRQTTTDPRMTGTRSIVLDLLSDSADDSSGNLGQAIVTLTNDGGAWACPMTFIHVVTDKVAAGEIEQWAGWCDGAGGYEGLAAYLAFRQPEDPASSGSQDVYGFIGTDGTLRMPEPPAG